MIGYPTTQLTATVTVTLLLCCDYVAVDIVVALSLSPDLLLIVCNGNSVSGDILVNGKFPNDTEKNNMK